MNNNDFSRSMSLLCPVCAGDQFDFDRDLQEEQRTYTCSSCNHVSSHEEIMSSNRPRIEAEVDQIGKEIIAGAAKNLNEAFKKFGK
ncbi:hypothetical protein [uncultured Litoreibacter sp.]|uniref:ECs_2282 family putative zinc-binding protein n=1 Tax=uncultured Litoreibacter sp. TaxID=1392394 RepID=UPI002611746D|nr:hypothetical protein [uncultured Litoreibacter sp.]